MNTTKKWIQISSKGLILPDDLMMLGATTKAGDDSKIGYFGSGTKFSLAYLSRYDIDFKIFSGEEEIKVTTVVKPYRGENVKVVAVNGVETNITERFGADWRAWFVIRELFSNAIDEGDADITTVDEITTNPDFTTIFIENTGDFRDVMNNFDMYFAQDRVPVEENTIDKKEVVIYRTVGETLRPEPRNVTIYRKGIRCNSLDSGNGKSVFDVDISRVSINESRILTDNYSVRRSMVQTLIQSHNPDILELFLERAAVESSWEEYLAETVYDDDNVSPVWEDVLRKYRVESQSIRKLVEFMSIVNAGEEEDNRILIFVPQELYLVLYANFPELVKKKVKGKGTKIFIEAPPTDSQFDVLAEAMKLAEQIGYDGTEVRTVLFRDKQVLATFDDKYIYVSTKLLDMGVLETVSALVEEHLHMSTGFGDLTRQFQTHILNLYCRAELKKKGVVL